MKKFIWGILISLGIGASTLYAATDDEVLEKVIWEAKSVVNVPSELSEFQYQIVEEKDKLKAFDLTWTDPKGEIEPISVRIEADGRIVRYNQYQNVVKRKKLATISYEEGLNVAEKFWSQVNSQYEHTFKLEKERKDQGNVYGYVFEEYVGEIPVLHSQVEITVDKQTGKVQTFSGLPTYLGAYRVPKQVIDEQTAYKLYLENLPFELGYHLTSQYEPKEVFSFPVYVAENRMYQGIDAQTGNLVTPYQTVDTLLYKGDMVESTEKSNALTKEEKIAKEILSTLLSKQEALEKATKVFNTIGKDSYEGNLYYNAYTKQFIWALYNEKVNLSVEAKTGEILSYNKYQDTSRDQQKASLTEEESFIKVEAFLKVVCPEQFKEVVYVPQQGNSNNLNSYYSFVRQVNELPVSGQGLTVGIDRTSGEIIAYNKAWNDYIQFKDIHSLFTKQYQENMDKKVMKSLGFGLYYVDGSEKERQAIYTVEVPYATFDPLTGEAIYSYNGKPVEKNEIPQYKDIKGHWAEEIIKRLVDSGIYLSGEYFNPNQPITQGEFLSVLLGYHQPYPVEDSVYNGAIQQGILKFDEKAPKKILTGKEAIIMIIDYLGYQEIAELDEIFVNPFEETTEAKGYFALAKGLNIIGEGFKPSDEVTRAQAFELIYHMLD